MPPFDSAHGFVGRHTELEILSASLEGAIGGHGGVVGLAGETGIGKSRLATEFAALAGSRGAAVLWGGCFEGDWRPAYGPWVEALSSIPTSVLASSLRGRLGWAVPVIARLLPEVASLVPNPPDVPPLGPDEEQLRLFEAVSQLLLAASSHAPMLLVIEDLHWADPDSLRLLRYVGRFVERRSLLLLLTYRSEEMSQPSDHPLVDVVPILRHEAGFRQIDLAGLGLDDLEECLSALAGAGLPRGLAGEILRETDGNPLYSGEILRHLTETGRIHCGDWSTEFGVAGPSVPAGVHRLTLRRMTRLSARTQGMLQLAAAFTAGFRFETLKEVVQLPDTVLLDCIDEALRTGLLVVTGSSPATYGFSHEIIRHAILEALNPDRRAGVHRDIALALERTHSGREAERAGELAAQYYLSASIPKAEKGVKYALVAADQAMSTYSRGRAALFLRIASELSISASPQERAHVLCRLAVAEAEANLLSSASTSASSAVESLTIAGASQVDLAAFLGRLARATKEAGAEPGLWKPLVERGLALVEDRHGLEWARLMLLRDRFKTVAIDGINVALWLGHDPMAVAIAREAGDENDYALTLEPMDWRDPEETNAVLDRTREWKNPTAILRALDVAGRDMLKRHGAHREAAALYAKMLRIAEESGSIAGQAEAELQLAIIHVVTGEFELARRTAREAQDLMMRLGPAHELHFGAVALNSILTFFLDGDWPQIAAAASRYATSPAASRNPRALVAGAYAALGYARAGDAEESRRLIAALTPVLGQMQPVMYVHHAAVAFGGSAVWETETGRFAPEYRRMALDLLQAGFGDSILVHELTVARMSSLLGKKRESQRYFQLAREKCDVRGLLAVRSIADYDEALALHRAGVSDKTRIVALLDSASAAFQSMGMQGWARRALSLEGIVALGDTEMSSARHALPAGLTNREAEVLALLAQGRTNREIAFHLLLSVRTVERHIENIYRRLGVHGRASATRYAIREGLAQQDPLIG